MVRRRTTLGLSRRARMPRREPGVRRVKIDVGGVEIFFDVEGPLVVGGVDGWEERPTVVLLHPGPGIDHSVYKDVVGPRLAEVAQVVYIDQRGDGRSDRSGPS